MFIGKIGLLFLYFLLYNKIYAKKLEEIFTCANETECDELIEKNVVEETSTTATENMFNTMSTNVNTNTYGTQTTKIPGIPTTPTTEKIKYNNEIKRPNIQKVASDICECDLTTLSCDINCCCDKDCSDFHITVFSHCENHRAELFDKRYCYNRNFIQRNNTPFILEKLTNNLFCILYDNLPPSYSVSNELDIKSEKDLLEIISSNKPKWRWMEDSHIPECNISSPYKDNDIVWIVNNTYIQPFELLQSGFTELCSFKKTVKYLREWKHQCLQTELNTTNKFLFPTAFTNFAIIVSPHLLNETYVEGLDEECPKNVCLLPTSYYCKQPWEDCSNNTISGYCSDTTCYNIVKGVKYVIIHNGTMGINSINVYFNLGNVSHSFRQQFEIVYEWAELDKARSFHLSGNPGYTLGMPLIIGTLKKNKTNNVEVKYINVNKTDRYFTLPIATRSGECNKIDRYIPLFGENIKVRCSASINSSNFSRASCIELQNLTMQYLLKDSLLNVSEIDQYNVYISKLGNFSNNDVADWVQIFLDRIPDNAISAKFINGRLQCSGLITSIHVNILYSTLAKPETLTNYNVLGVGIMFSTKSNTSWLKCLGENCTDLLKVDVISYVTFHDVSKQSKYYFVGAPNLDLTLPYDFFYPFLSSSACIKSQNIFLIMIALTVIAQFY